MKSVLSLLFVSIISISFAQSNLTIFNNGDQAFYVILNGIKQNQFPQKNVCVTNISGGGYALKVVFANGASADIDKKLYLNEPSDIRMGIEFKKGLGKLKIISYEPTQGLQSSGVVFRPTDNAIYSDAPVVQTQSTSTTNQSGTNTNQPTIQSNQTGTITTNQNVVPTQQNQAIITQSSPSGQTTNTTNSTTTTTVTTTGNVATPTTTTTNLNGGVNINMGLNGMNMSVTDPVTGQNMNMNINVNGLNGANTNMTGTSSTSSSSQTTTTTVTSSSQTSTNTNRPAGGNTVVTSTTSTSGQSNPTTNAVIQSSSINQVNSTSTNQNVVVFNRGLAKANCTKSIGNIDVYVKELKALSFESDQVEAIEKDLATTCLTSAQAYKIVEILTFESNRLDIAKFLSDRMINRDKAGELLPLFTFDSNKVEYKDYIR